MWRLSFITILIASSSSAECNLAQARTSALKETVINTQRVTLENRKLHAPNGSVFPYFTMEERSFGPYQTMVYHPTRIQPENASVIVPMFHGMNADVSQGGSMLPMANNLTKLNKEGAGAKGIYAEAMDLPGCGNNSNVHALDTFESTLDFYTQYLKKLKERAPGKPIVPIGYCYSAGFLLEVAKRNPGLIDGLILNALIPTETSIFKDSYLVESQMYREKKLAMNPAVRDRADQAYSHLDISTDSTLLGKTPILLLIGEKDPFQTEDAFKWFKRLADHNEDHLKYMLVPNGGHGVLSPVKEYPENFPMVSTAVQELIDRVKQNYKK